MAKHEDLPVPIHSKLDEVYGDGSQVEEAQLRFSILDSKFEELFGHLPDLYARAPGYSSLSSPIFLCR